MDRNDLQDNGPLDHHQFFLDMPLILGFCNKLKLKIYIQYFFIYNFFKKWNSSENSRNFTGRGPYHVNTYSVGIFQKYLILFVLEQHKE